MTESTKQNNRFKFRVLSFISVIVILVGAFILDLVGTTTNNFVPVASIAIPSFLAVVIGDYATKPKSDKDV